MLLFGLMDRYETHFDTKNARFNDFMVLKTIKEPLRTLKSHFLILLKVENPLRNFFGL